MVRLAGGPGLSMNSAVVSDLIVTMTQEAGKRKRRPGKEKGITKCSWMRTWNEMIEIEIGRDMKMMG